MTLFNTSREIPATPEQVFEAFCDAKRLEQWWGPAGFTNTFSVCEFMAGGRWIFVMKGPDGRQYPNENIFAEIDPLRKVVVKHASEPKYVLTITLAAASGGTLVSWSQNIENPEMAERLRHIVVPANEQNLDRLKSNVMQKIGGAGE